MIRLRPYKASDASLLLQWAGEERPFMLWCAGKFAYPLTAEQLERYRARCEDDEHSWAFTALREDGMPVGHFLMRMADYGQESVHLGFVIVDPSQRGKGVGKEMLRSALHYAFACLGMKRVTLGVFDSNPAAHHCYLSAGLQDVSHQERYFSFREESWGLFNMEATQDSFGNPA